MHLSSAVQLQSQCSGSDQRLGGAGACRIGEGRAAGRRGGRGQLRTSAASAFSAAAVARLRRRAGGLQFRDHRIGIDRWSEAGVAKSPGLRITCTGTVTGWNLGSVKVTEKPASGAGTATEQGVLQPGPSEVMASAPEGTDSSWTWIGGGADLKESQENEEQPARQMPRRRQSR